MSARITPSSLAPIVPGPIVDRETVRRFFLTPAGRPRFGTGAGIAITLAEFGARPVFDPSMAEAMRKSAEVWAVFPYGPSDGTDHPAVMADGVRYSALGRASAAVLMGDR